MNATASVDNLHGQQWLGCVVPKRHAKRAVTRNLIKRQMRQVFADRATELPAGLWLLRLSQGFPVNEFVSARSAALSLAVKRELEQLLAHPRLRQVPLVAPLTVGQGVPV
jgi:ribonuclease P protein component